MKKFLTTHIMLTVHLLIFVVAISFGAWVAHHDKQLVVEHIEQSIDAQISLMTTIAVTTKRNGGDEVVSTIIQDCPRRGDFDVMLGNLNTLSPKELITMQQLFESCGSFFAERKALMVSRLVREYAILKDAVALLNTLTDTTNVDLHIDDWGRLVTLEEERSRGLTELVAIQKDIIVALIRNDADSTKNVKALVLSATELNESLSVTSTQIQELHDKLIE